jgi:hypothetical protein
MNMKTATLIFLAAILVGGCGPKQLYLVGPKIGDEQPDILKVCLYQALNQVNSGAPPLTSEEKAPLKGIQTEFFLWWGSLSGPKPVITTDHLPGEARAMPWPNSSKEVSDRYVLCLLANGYEFPNEEWVKGRFGESK